MRLFSSFLLGSTITDSLSVSLFVAAQLFGYVVVVKVGYANCLDALIVIGGIRTNTVRHTSTVLLCLTVRE